MCSVYSCMLAVTAPVSRSEPLNQLQMLW